MLSRVNAPMSWDELYQRKELNNITILNFTRKKNYKLQVGEQKCNAQLKEIANTRHQTGLGFLLGGISFLLGCETIPFIELEKDNVTVSISKKKIFDEISELAEILATI